MSLCREFSDLETESDDIRIQSTDIFPSTQNRRDFHDHFTTISQKANIVPRSTILNETEMSSKTPVHSKDPISTKSQRQRYGQLKTTLHTTDQTRTPLSTSSSPKTQYFSP